MAELFWGERTMKNEIAWSILRTAKWICEETDDEMVIRYIKQIMELCDLLKTELGA
jgi:hypothetical protein